MRSGFLFLVLLLIACAGSPRYCVGGSYKLQQADARARRAGAKVGAYQVGLASYYGVEANGRQTASGEIYDMYALTAAHRELPFGTAIEVTNLANDLSVIVRVNDWGPPVEWRILDLSYGAALQIGLIGPGSATVKVSRLKAAGRGPLEGVKTDD